jgi:glycosyltransferase involved in cell wall biosynthesis
MPQDIQSPLRILHLNSMLTGGGTDNQCAHLACGLMALGQKIWVAGPPGKEFSQVIADLGVPLVETPVHEGPVKLRFILSAAQFIRREKIQLVHGHHGRDIWPAILAARLSMRRPKVVLTRHLAKSPSTAFSRRFLLGQCDAVIAVSESVAGILKNGAYEPEAHELERRSRPPLRGDHSKIHVIYGGMDVDRFQPMDARDQRRAWGLEPGHYAFAVAGGYDLPRGKGQVEFLLAAARIHEKIPDARFLIIGRGTMEGILRGTIEELGLMGKAFLIPYCRDMPKAMNAIDCLVHPQVGTEAFGLVLCEAFACGRPVIASALDGIPEAFAVGKYGRLVKPDSVEELAQAMLEWANHPPLSAPERAALHERVEREFSWLVSARRVLELYRSLVCS